MNQDLSFRYWFAHLDVAGVSCERPWALLLLLGLPLLLRTWRGAWIWRLRAVAYALLVLALADVRLTARLPESRLSVVAAVDLSDSIDEEGRRWTESYVRSLAASLPPGDELGVLQFGENAEVLRTSAPPARLEWTRLPVRGGGTNIAAAMDAALALFPPQSERRLVLITDGNETQGSSLDRLAALRFAEATLFAAVPPRASGPDAAVERIVAPKLLTQGAVSPLRVVVRNDASPREAVLELLVDGESMGRETIQLQVGKNAIEIPYQLDRAGVHRVGVRIAMPGDTVSGNDARDVAITVTGKPRVLLVTPLPQSVLRQPLRRKGFEVTQIVPAELPSGAKDFLGFHAVVFESVTGKSLGARSIDGLEAYVRDHGGGFWMVGGESSFGDVELKRTALERLLPVTLEPRKPPKREREPLALFLLIDRSKSMGYHFRNRFEFSDEQSKLVYAKRAALSVVRQLRDSDQLGVIAFDSLAFEIAPLRPLRENRVILERDLPRIQVGGGTDFYDGLRTALRQLAAARATNGHVILLTDGNTNRPPGEHDEIIAGLAKAKISVTTIRVGDDQEEISLLKKISQRTGGAFHSIANAEALPDLLLRDTRRQVAETPQGEQSFVPRADDLSALLRGLDVQTIPAVSGYAFARLRPRAEQALHVVASDKKDPLLATWQLGLGRVAALTVDPSADAKSWLAWSGFGKLCSQALRWVAMERRPGDYAITPSRRDDGIEVVLEGVSGDGVVTAKLLDAGQAMDVPLTPSGPGRLVGHIVEAPGGRYTLALSTRMADGSVQQSTQSFVVAAGSDAAVQRELERLQPNLDLLQTLARETGGSVNAPVRSITGRSSGTRRVDLPLDAYLVPLAMLAILAAIAWQRLFVFPVPSLSSVAGTPPA